MPDTRVFRALHLPNHRREAENETDGAPVNVPPGELLYGETENKLYMCQNDGTVVEISGGASSGPVTDWQVDGNLYFKDFNDNSDATYITKQTPASNTSVLQIFIGDDGGANVNGYYPASGATDYVAIMTTGGSTHHLFGSDGKYYNAGGITFGNGTTQTSAGVPSNPTGITGAAAITNIVSISQAAYDALATKDATTLYVING